MKTALIFLVIAILILAFFWSKADVWFSRSTIDIHFHDTYFVIARWHAILMVILFIGTFSSLGGLIGTKFQNRFFLTAFIIFVLVDAYILWKILSL